MNINRNNYEEYFILYSDNELNSDDRRRVDEFVLFNPDLKDELDIYLNSILTTDASLKFENKEDLHRYDESILSYIDDELPADEKEKLEELIGGSPRLQQELNFYLKTKLQTDTEIVFENKSILYRSTEKRRVAPMQMIRWAAAAAILIAVSITAINYFNKQTGATDIAKTNPPEKKDPVPDNTIENVAVAKDEKKVETPIAPDKNIAQPAIAKSVKPDELALTTDKQKKISPKEIKQKTVIVPNEKKKGDIAINAKPSSNNLPSPQLNPLFNGNNPKNSDVIADIDHSKNEKNVNADKIEKSGVTNYTTPPLYISSTTIDTELNTDEENKNKKSRGLLRKITRLFEKNTGIKATDDDKLRIAAFTVKL